MKLKEAIVLVVDDDTDVLTAMRILLRPLVREVLIEKNPENLKKHLVASKPDVVFLDMNFKASIHTGNEGLFWLRKIKETTPEVSVVMITAYGGIDLAVTSLKEGASDFVVKPWQNEKLLTTLNEVLDKKSVGKKDSGSKSNSSGSGMLGDSPEMQDIFVKIRKIAPTEANVLILGENGTGKELVAQAIHEQSIRKNQPFVKVDLGALTESLFESELFGYKKGAFTDAREDRAGRFESANGGTLFLDEIGNISLQQQAKLLSVLQNRMVNRLGSNQPIPIDIRLICATNVPLKDLADETRFRKDLIYRINTVEINLPGLRNRSGDIGILARHFAGVYAQKYSKPNRELSKDALQKLSQYPFPGNVRELQYTLERAVIMAEGEKISADDILFSQLESPLSGHEDPDDLRLSSVEKSTILKVIQKHNGNITNAAKELGLTRTALYRRLDKYDI
ncbi:MAG TPA: sigma-54 dependent transcriptional regulator [Catalimonadaceae bacterium]|jgi:two-component system response regulator HydG|nr:sigma-54 dependent transcriptional regulator [Catalimonadaceae bacterium]